jgi:NADPH:quinone reductase-like Zn-dependent oxidoreductase
MRKRFSAAMMVLAITASTTAPGAAQAADLPTAARKVVLEKVETGYRWKVIQAPVPTPAAHQVLVRVHAVALNRGDLDRLKPTGSDRTGLVPATDASGDVVAVGSEVRDVRPGMRVTSMYFRNWLDGPSSEAKMSGVPGASIDGVLADYILMEDTAVVPAPDGFSHEEAATLPTAGLTAWTALTRAREIRRGDVVLTQGTGGVSAFVVQIASALGARVIVTSSSEDKLRRMKALGAHEGINYRAVPAWADRVQQLTGQHGADVVIDLGGRETLEQSVASVAHFGTVSIVGGLTGYSGQLPALPLLAKNARAQGVYVGSRADFLRMNAFMAERRLRPVIERVFPLEQFPEALELLASGNFVGKIVLRLTP